MKNLLLFLAFIPALLFAQDPQTKGFVITGTITGLPDGDVKITSTSQQGSLVASGIAKQGVFTIQGSIPEPGLYFLVLDDQQPQYVFLENKPIKISGDIKDLKHLNVEGSESQKDFEVFNN